MRDRASSWTGSTPSFAEAWGRQGALGNGSLDKAGPDLPLQIVSERYEWGSLIVTNSKNCNHGPAIFNNDAGITAAIFDRLLHAPGLSSSKASPTRWRSTILPPPLLSQTDRSVICFLFQGVPVFFYVFRGGKSVHAHELGSII